MFNFIEKTNVTYYKRVGTISHRYTVMNEMWHNVVFQLCTPNNKDYNTIIDSTAIAYLDGLITFRNPYGFIPAELYGILPFEV